MYQMTDMILLKKVIFELSQIKAAEDTIKKCNVFSRLDHFKKKSLDFNLVPRLD